MGTIVKLGNKEVELNGQINNLAITDTEYNENNGISIINVRYPGSTQAKRTINTYDDNGKLLEINTEVYDITQKRKIHLVDKSKIATSRFSHNDRGLISHIDTDEYSTDIEYYPERFGSKTKSYYRYDKKTGNSSYYEYFIDGSVKTHNTKKIISTDSAVLCSNSVMITRYNVRRNRSTVEESYISMIKTDAFEVITSNTSVLYNVHAKHKNDVPASCVEYRYNNTGEFMYKDVTNFTSKAIGPRNGSHRRYVVTNQSHTKIDPVGNKSDRYDIRNNFDDDGMLTDSIFVKYNDKGEVESETKYIESTRLHSYENCIITHNFSKSITTVTNTIGDYNISIEFINDRHTRIIKVADNQGKFDWNLKSSYTNKDDIEPSLSSDEMSFKDDKQLIIISKRAFPADYIPNAYIIEYSSLNENQAEYNKVELNSNSNEAYVYLYSIIEESVPMKEIIEFIDDMAKRFAY